ncbi:hypothetical protein [Flavobacterium okayamense]|uniref:Lipoprotein n=1 Tax=Flavobacterium okayamense TaxID=2830782 RepID=A0ABN6I382_9FLAO|nr:hypothetical protein [Flavobacterium okayamense]BCY28898.1 hypothetical protein KK2020170_17660 [Flavobacterium okayamense]
MKVIYILPILFLFFSCKKNDEIISEKLLQNSEGEDYISLVCDEFQKDTFDLTKNEILITDSLTKHGIKNLNIYLNSEQELFKCEPDNQINIEDYVIQYCGHFDNFSKEKVVSIQLLLKENLRDKRWKNTWIRNIGGGCNYVHGEINLTKKTSSNFFTNAPY